MSKSYFTFWADWGFFTHPLLSLSFIYQKYGHQTMLIHGGSDAVYGHVRRREEGGPFCADGRTVRPSACPF